MNLNDYAGQFGPTLQALATIQQAIDELNANPDVGDTDQEWLTFYSTLLGECMISELIDPEVLTSIARYMLDDPEQPTDAKSMAEGLVAHLTHHYQGLAAMVGETASILGSFGAGGITFVPGEEN